MDGEEKRKNKEQIEWRETNKVYVCKCVCVAFYV